MVCQYRAIWGAPWVRACLLSLIPLAVQAEDTPEANVIPAVEVNADAEEGASYITEQQAAKTGKLDVAVEDTPFAISVVNEEFIRDTGAKNIEDALRYSSGVYAGAFGFDTRGDWAKVRGMDASFYLDGLRSIYGSYNSVRTNVYALEQVEVLKGPSSVLYGQSELGGIINSVSKLPKPVQQGELWAQAGSFDRKQLAADVTGPLSKDGKLLYRLVALKRDSGTQVDYVDDDGFLFAPSITWLATDNTTISVLFNAQENSGGVSAQFLPAEGTIDPGVRGDVPSETFVGEPDWDRYDREKNEVTLFVDHRLNEAWNIAATGRYTSSSSETRQHWAAIGAGVAPNGDTPRTIYMADNDTEVKNVDIRLEGDVDLGVTRHRLAVGVDRQDALWEQGNYFYGYGQGGTINLYNPAYGTVNYAALNPVDRPDNQIKQSGIYVIDHMDIGNFAISSALRHDNSTNKILAVSGPDTKRDDEETTGRLGVMYHFAFGLSPYLSYSQSFTPNLGANAADQSLDASTGEQEEAGLKYLNDSGDFSVTAAYFYIEETNRVIPSGQAQQVDQIGAKSEGWELEIKKMLGNLEVQASMTDLRAIDDENGVRLPYVADRLVSGWGKYALENGLRVGGGVRYIGDNVGFGGGPKVPAETLYDVMLGYGIQNWDLSMNVQNLTDEEYISWCRGPGTDCGYGERRTVTANARYRF